ncbi:hypothetical protein WOSG25_050210 [Weissella oryzae SG25]|uniref:Thioester domain-containing protein n=1 Tax=Weissella oryzae (strain DSM 25784 / JCM 18191 / LMG 30913 / SG25) TaxID=1329250 RepID=A0A069CTG3_WEIOS|nr:thioester domain-containing protein [Weissella oryzae]GAK30749.1 hypothetical protein WOSG25_050210 [Weissella oryzae SG25]
MYISMKQARKFKRTMALASITISLAGIMAPVVASADTALPTNVTQLMSSKLKSLNGDMNGLGALTYHNGDTSKIGYYVLNGDNAGSMVNNTEHNNVAIGYGGVTPTAVMWLNGQFIYCIQNSKGNPVGKDGVHWDDNLSKYASNLIQDVMVLGFPNASSSDLGFTGENSALHAYMATQYAIWAAEQDGKVESADGGMVDLSSLSDNAGVAQAGYKLYQKAQALEAKGGVASLTADTHDKEEATAKAKLTADLTKAVASKTTELNNKVNADLTSKETAKKSEMQNYMKSVSDKALSTVDNNAKTDAINLLSNGTQAVNGDKYKATATLTNQKYAYLEKTDNTRVFSFSPKATMPKFDLGVSDVHSLVRDKTIDLKVDKNYTGSMTTTASGNLSANTDTGDTINALTIKLDKQLPDGSYLVQDGQKLTSKDGQTYTIKNGVDFEVHVPASADSDTDSLGYEVVGNTVISLSDFKELAKTNLSGKDSVQSSASDTAKVSEEYTYQKGAEVGVIGAGVAGIEGIQNVGTIILNVGATQATDKVEDSQVVKVGKNKDVNANYSDQKEVKVNDSKTATRKASANNKFSWDKDAVAFANTGLTINKYLLAGLVTTLLAGITGVVVYFKKFRKVNVNK